jgi:hypothetical protein
MIVQVAINLLKRTASEAQDKLNARKPIAAAEQIRTAAQTVLDELEVTEPAESEPAGDNVPPVDE